MEARESQKYTFVGPTLEFTRSPGAPTCALSHTYGKGREGGWKAEKSEAEDATEAQVRLPVTRNANSQEMSVDWSMSFIQEASPLGEGMLLSKRQLQVSAWPRRLERDS